MTVNAQYNLARPGSLPIWIAGYQRAKMFAAFLKDTGISATDTVLDVGATSDCSYHHSNYLEAWYPEKERITAVGIDDATFLESVYPGLRFFRADGRDLPFEDRTFDYVHSSAVLEHVGSRDQQVQFLGELWRVARKAIFVTTPDRRFPIEFHTMMPLLHWLPPCLFRRTLVLLGKEFFASEAHLNLLSRRDLAAAACSAGIHRFRIATVGLLGLSTNLLLYARKPTSP